VRTWVSAAARPPSPQASESRGRPIAEAEDSAPARSRLPSVGCILAHRYQDSSSPLFSSRHFASLAKGLGGSVFAQGDRRVLDAPPRVGRQSVTAPVRSGSPRREIPSGASWEARSEGRQPRLMHARSSPSFSTLPRMHLGHFGKLAMTRPSLECEPGARSTGRSAPLSGILLLPDPGDSGAICAADYGESHKTHTKGGKPYPSRRPRRLIAGSGACSRRRRGDRDGARGELCVQSRLAFQRTQCEGLKPSPPQGPRRPLRAESRMRPRPGPPRCRR